MFESEDDFEQPCDATADGILQCLQMLAEEAAALNMPRTLEAIQRALAVCQEEGAEAQPLIPMSGTIH